MSPPDPRAIAIHAASLGWMRPEDLWDLAWKCAREEASGPEVLATLLDPERLETLTGGPPVDAASPVLPLHDAFRYKMREGLGKGAAGEVVAAVDRETQRVVALKTLNEAARSNRLARRRFVQEARITAQLEHPNIVPIYDLSADPDREPFYTMRIVKNRSLADVLRDPELRAQWSLVRLLAVIAQVCRALAYAHSRGVVHHDVKPGNILLGDFGEVYVADWGVARVSAGSDLALQGEGSAPPPRNEYGGTPAYMPPEMFGIMDASDHRADLFAVGVILYEVLTGERPFRAPTVDGVIKAICTVSPPRPSELAAGCPLLLEDVCLALLSKDPNRRPSSAEQIVAQIEAFLEGTKETARRKEEALSLVARGAEAALRYRTLDAERERCVEAARAALKDVKGWEPAEKKTLGWELEDAAERADREANKALAGAVELHQKALGYDPECADAHKGLADLFWSQARVAEAERRPAAEVYYEELVRDHDRGPYATILKADARLSLKSNPPGARVVAYRYVEHQRVLAACEPRELGVTPVCEVHLDPGSYLLVVSASGFRDVRYPVLLARGAHHEGTVNLYTDAEIGEGFVHIPAGTAILGGDDEAYGSLPRQEILIGDFAMGAYPVTTREYCAFLDDLERSDPGLAQRRSCVGQGGVLVGTRRGPSGWEPDPAIIEGDARHFFPAEQGHLWRVPASLVGWFDAAAFCAWKTSREDVSIRLPTEGEWEKAARGTDGRFYPWGDRFDPTFCCMRESRSFMSQPEPVGTFPIDCSPYGVRDMAGGVREWVADLHGERGAAEVAFEPEPSTGARNSEWTQSGMRQARSGSWNTDRKWCRSASRGPMFGTTRGTGLSFRLAKSLPPRA